MNTTLQKTVAFTHAQSNRQFYASDSCHIITQFKDYTVRSLSYCDWPRTSFVLLGSDSAPTFSSSSSSSFMQPRLVAVDTGAKNPSSQSTFTPTSSTSEAGHVAARVPSSFGSGERERSTTCGKPYESAEKIKLHLGGKFY